MLALKQRTYVVLTDATYNILQDCTQNSNLRYFYKNCDKSQGLESRDAKYYPVTIPLYLSGT